MAKTKTLNETVEGLESMAKARDKKVQAGESLSNLERAESVGQAPAVFAKDMGVGHDEAHICVGDFLANLMHFCRIGKIDFDDCMDSGINHFNEESD